MSAHPPGKPEKTKEEKEQERESYTRNTSHIYIRTGILTSEQVNEIIETFFADMRDRANVQGSELYPLRKEILSANYELNIVSPKGENLEKPYGYLYVSSPVVYWLAFGKNPDGTERIGMVKKCDIPDFEEEEVKKPIPPKYEDFVEENKRVTQTRGRSKWTEEEEEDLSLEEMKKKNRLYQLALENYENKLRAYESYMCSEVMAELEPLAFPLYAIGSMLDEEQQALSRKILIAEAVKNGEDPDDIDFPLQGTLQIRRGFAEDFNYFYRKSEEQTILKSHPIYSSFVTEKLIFSLFEKFNTDKLGFTEKGTRVSKPYPVVTSYVNNAGGTVFIVKFSDRPNSASDARFAHHMRAKTLITNPANPSEVVSTYFWHKRIEDEDKETRRNNEIRSNHLAKSKVRKSETYGGFFASRTEQTWARTPVAALTQDFRRIALDRPETSRHETHRPETSRPEIENVWERKPALPKPEVKKYPNWRKTAEPVKAEPVKVVEEEEEEIFRYFPLRNLVVPFSSKIQEPHFESMIERRKKDEGFTEVVKKGKAKKTEVKVPVKTGNRWDVLNDEE
jgi:hypothetical protein